MQGTHVICFPVKPVWVLTWQMGKTQINIIYSMTQSFFLSRTAPFHHPCPSTLWCTSLPPEQRENVCSYSTGLLQVSEPKVLIINWDLKIITRRQQSRQLSSTMTKYAEQGRREECAPCLLVSVQLRGMLISMFISMASIVTILFLLHWIFLLLLYSLE